MHSGTTITIPILYCTYSRLHASTPEISLAHPEQLESTYERSIEEWSCFRIPELQENSSICRRRQFSFLTKNGKRVPETLQIGSIEHADAK